MTRLTWGEEAKRNYEYGVDRVVFYPKNGIGYSWNGVTTIKETTEDASQSLIWVDGMGHANQLLLGTFAASIDAVTYPEEFEPFDGYSGFRTAQTRGGFDLCYRTMQDGGYKLHLVYNCVAAPTDRNNSTINSAFDVELFGWDLTTRPEVIPYARATSHFVIDTKYVWPDVIDVIEARLYGTDASAPDMPSVDELINLFFENAQIIVTPHPDGTVTVSGPDANVSEIAHDFWKLEWPTVEWLDDTQIRITSF